MKTFRKLDLHIHSTASDGSWSPKKIIKKVKENGVDIISLTDHDSVDNLHKIKGIAEQEGVTFIPGVEISSTLEGELFHILGYNIDYNNKKLKDIINKNTILLEEKDDNFIKLLIEKGYNIHIEDYINYEHNSSRGGWKALSFLIDAGLCTDVKDFFTRLWIAENQIEFPVFPHPKEVIEIIQKSGGTAVLAHPYYSPCTESVDSRLSRFLKMDIQGVECFHPNHNEEISKECLVWCNEKNLISTAGSDSHGDFIVTRHIGIPKIHENEVNISKLLNV